MTDTHFRTVITVRLIKIFQARIKTGPFPQRSTGSLPVLTSLSHGLSKPLNTYGQHIVPGLPVAAICDLLGPGADHR